MVRGARGEGTFTSKRGRPSVVPGVAVTLASHRAGGG